jgi:hypothetical protein
MENSSDDVMRDSGVYVGNPYLYLTHWELTSGPSSWRSQPHNY